MAYRRGRYRRRRTFRRRYRRRFVRGRRRGYRRRLNQNTTYRFSRTYVWPALIGSTVSYTSNGIAFQLSDLPSYSDFASLFDFYRIRGARIKFIPRKTVNDDNSYNGDFYTVADYDDVISPTETDLQSKQGVKVRYSIGRPWSIFIRPVASIPVYNGALSTSAYAQARRRMWLDMANPSVPHYGLKWGWTQVQTPVTIDVFITLYVECKGVQ